MRSVIQRSECMPKFNIQNMRNINMPGFRYPGHKMLYVIVLLVLTSLILVQCTPKMVVSSREDYELLDDLKKFEYEYSLHEGIKFKLLGDFPRAVFFLERCIELFPFSDVAYYELSKIYLLAGETEKSLDYAGKALDLVNDNIWYHHHMARLYIETGSNKRAIEVYEAAKSIFPDEIDVYFTLAALYSSEKQYDNALEIYDYLEDLIGVDEKISLPREHIYIEKGEFEKAHTEIQNLIDKNPQEARYYGILAELYTSMQMYKEALDSYKKLFSLDPENGMAQLSVADFYLQRGNFEEARFYLISAFRNQGLDVTEKVSIYSSIVQNKDLIDKHFENIEQLGHLLIEEYPDQNFIKAVMSDMYIYSGEYPKAEKILFGLYTSDPDNSFFAEQYIAVLSFNEKYDEVINIGEELLNKFEKSISIHYFLGVAYYVREETHTAIDIFKNTLQMEGINPEIKIQVLSYLGDLLNTTNDFKSSDEYFEQALEIDANNVYILNNFAYYLALRGEKLEKALEFSRKTISSEPENSSFLDTYAWILYKLGKYEEALIYIEKAYVKGGSESYEITKHYGMILMELDKYPEAIDFLDKARNLTKDTYEIDIIISKIKQDYNN
jgi:tetratricopeptide (TPR) repeat protein